MPPHLPIHGAAQQAGTMQADSLRFTAEAAKAITDFICDNQGDYPQYTAEGKFMQTYPGMGSSNFAPSPNT